MPDRFIGMGGSGHRRGEVDATDPYQPGDPIVIREIWKGRVWYARPATVVRDEPNITMLLVPPHVRAKEPIDDKGRPLRIPATDWTFRDIDRGDTWNLSFAFPDTQYSVILGFEATGDLREYYVNLQTPLVRSPAGFDTVEHILDVTIPPDRTTWSWKDEDELAEAVDAGLFTEEDAAWFRYWGERAVEHVLLREPPFDEDWSDWSPDPSWEEPALPADWELAPA
jgi:Protein of unknown function (DUF402)